MATEREWLEGLRYEDKFPDEPDCPCCLDEQFVIYGDERLPCPQCRPNAYDEAIRAAFPRNQLHKED